MALALNNANSESVHNHPNNSDTPIASRRGGFFSHKLGHENANPLDSKSLLLNQPFSDSRLTFPVLNKFWRKIMKLLTWIVVANNSSARFFTTESQSAPLTEIETLTHSEGRLHDRDMTSDLPGRNKGECGTGGHAFDQATDPKEHEAEQFAHHVAKHLEVARNEHKVEQLVLVAEPSFLGLLRRQLSDQVAKMVCFELDSNIVNLTPTEIRAHLPEFLPHLH